MDVEVTSAFGDLRVAQRRIPEELAKPDWVPVRQLPEGMPWSY